MNELKHHGVKGQKWGVRRYQNKDGSLTPAGRRKQATYDKAKKAYENRDKISKEYFDQRRKLPRDQLFRDENLAKTRKRLWDADRETIEHVRNYLSTLDDKRVKDLVEFDREHGRHFVEARLFDKSIDPADPHGKIIYLD